jgi:nitrogen fixation/metabolism regulation signal transduction histidine kinase
MTRSGYLFLGLTAIVGMLAAVLAFAVLRLFAAARAAAKRDKVEGTETAFMAAAMEDAVQRLRDQERAMKARAEASERLSSEIIASMTSGLLVVSEERHVRSLNPAGRKMLALPEGEWSGDFREVLASAAPLAEVVEECLTTARPIVRRTIALDGAGAAHLGATASPIRDEAGRAHGAICLFQRPQRDCRARGSTAIEGQSRAARRTDRGDRPRIPQRTGHHSRLRAAAGSRSAAC